MSEPTKKETMTIAESATIIAKCISDIVDASTNENFKDFMKNNLKYKNAAAAVQEFSPPPENEENLYETTLRELIEKQFVKKCRRGYVRKSQEFFSSQFSQDSAVADVENSQKLPLSKRFREMAETFHSSQNSFTQSSQCSSSKLDLNVLPNENDVKFGDVPLKMIFDDDELNVLSQHFLDDSVDEISDDDDDEDFRPYQPRRPKKRSSKSNAK